MEKFSMKYRWVIWTAVILLAALFMMWTWQGNKQPLTGISQPENTRFQTLQTFISSPLTDMKLTSTAFENNASIPSKYTCDGQNISPPLNISDVPANAKSLVLIVHDPDAPRAGGFTHWVMWNIPPKTANIEENSVPSGAVQGGTDSGTNKWTSPCPPSGVHHYQFMLFALDTELNLPAGTVMPDLRKAMEGHVLGQDTLVGLYKRK